MGSTLITLIVAQGILGTCAIFVTSMTAGVTPRPFLDVLVTTVHQGVGAALLAVATAILLWNYRLVEPRTHPATSP